MKKNAPSGSAAVANKTDPDDALELTDGFFDQAEAFQGNTFVRRGPGRPKSEARKELISVRLDPDIVSKLREAGPGWQSQINALLRRSLRLTSAKTRSVAALVGAKR